MLQKLFFSFGLLFSITVYSQVGNLDSVEKVINGMVDDTAKVKQLRDVAAKIERVDSNLAKQFYRKAISISKSIKNKKELAISYLNIAAFKINFNAYDSAEIFGKMALNIATEIKSTPEIAKSYNIIGNSFLRRSNYNKAIENYLKSANLYEQIDEPKRLALVLSNITATYSEIDETDKAIFYGEKAIFFAERSKDNDAIARSNFNLGAAYSTKEDYEKCIKLYKKGLPFAQKSGIEYFIQQGFHNIGNCYFLLGKKNGIMDKQAQLYVDSGLILSKKINNPLSLFHSFDLEGRLATFYNDLPKAESYFKEAYKNLIQDSSNFVLRMYYGSLAELRYKQGDYKEAYNFQLKRSQYNDSVSSTDKLNTIANTATKYETEKKETQLKLQQSTIKQKNTLNILFGSIAAAILLVSLVSYKNYRNKQQLQQQKISELETQQQLSATEAVLKGEEQERTRLAKDLHDGLGGMLSGIKYSFNNMKENLVLTPETAQAFNRSMDMLDNSIQEMRRVAHNMMPESLVRYGLDKTLQDYISEMNKTGMVKVVYQSMGMENKIVDNTTAITIYRIVQELLNNVTKHASAKQVLVQLLAQGNKLVVNVEDDGRGFDTTIIEKADGIGWKNIKSRVEFLKGTLEVQSGEDKGTAVNLEFNI
jgi:two-component system, NarL family, sensor kinase